MSELGAFAMKRFRCYHGTRKRPCMVDLVARDVFVLARAVEHVRGEHKAFAASVDDLEARLAEELEDAVTWRPQGAGRVLFACQDLCEPGLWRCEFVRLGATPGECVEAAVAHFAEAHPRLVPDVAVLRAAVRSAQSRKESWDVVDTPLRERWARR